MGSDLQEGIGTSAWGAERKGSHRDRPEARLTNGDDVSGDNLIAGDGPPLPAPVDLGRGEGPSALGPTVRTTQVPP